MPQVLPLGRRRAADRGEAALRGGHRLQGGRGLRPVGKLACRHLQSARWAGEARLHRHATARHRHLAPRPGRPHQGGAGGREGRDLHQRAAGHARLLQAPRGHCRADGRRLPAHRRRGAHGRAGLLLHRGPHQGPHHLVGLQRLSAPHRGGDLRAPGGGRGDRDRHQGQEARRGAEGVRAPEARHER